MAGVRHRRRAGPLGRAVPGRGRPLPGREPCRSRSGGAASPTGTDVLAVARPPKQARPFQVAPPPTSRSRRVALVASAGVLALAVLGGVAAFGIGRIGASTEAGAETPAAVDTSAPAPSLVVPVQTPARKAPATASADAPGPPGPRGDDERGATDQHGAPGDDAGDRGADHDRAAGDHGPRPTMVSRRRGQLRERRERGHRGRDGRFGHRRCGQQRGRWRHRSRGRHDDGERRGRCRGRCAGRERLAERLIVAPARPPSIARRWTSPVGDRPPWTRVTGDRGRRPDMEPALLRPGSSRTEEGRWSRGTTGGQVSRRAAPGGLPRSAGPARAGRSCPGGRRR